MSVEPDGASTLPDYDVLDTVEDVLARADAGEDVASALAVLPPELRAQVNTVLEGQRKLLGLPGPNLAIPPVVQPGGTDLLAGRYQILSELGRGGMGVVYLANDRQQAKRVVVKVMSLDKAWNPRMRARFAREARALRKIHRHPNVVYVVDAGEDSVQGPYLVMEFVEGRELMAEINQRARIDPLNATAIARDVARGLAVVHRHGLIHRDVKPANVMLTVGGRAKLVDFGLAKDTFLTTITKTGQVIGTSFYMAPEQWDEGLKEDSRCDIFSLGATLYHMLVGTPPFLGDDLAEIMEECLCGEYEPAEDEVDGLPGDLPLVLHQMLATDRRYRYARMDDVAEDLDRVLRGDPCRVPCLVDAKAVRHPLFPGRRWTLGRDERCHITVADPTVSRQHAEVRRESVGYVLRDLDSSYGTSVGERKVSQPYTLRGGDLVDLGDVRLTFHDPHNRPEGSADDVVRRASPDPVVRLLVEFGDRRTVAALIERLQPDPAEERGLRDAVAALLGPKAGDAVALARERRAARVHSDLAAITSEIDLGGTDGWLAWWDHARYDLRAQVGAARRLRPLRLCSSQDTELVFGEGGSVLLGRDARCHMVLESQRVSRLHTTLFRLHTRWVARDEGSAAGTRLGDVALTYAFLNPGAQLHLGDVVVTLEQAPVPVLPSIGPGLYVLDPVGFEALLDERHPSVAAALVGFLCEDTAWIAGEAVALYPADAARQRAFAERLRSVYAERVALARQVLPALLGSDAGADPAAWEALLHARASSLPAQMLPRGWLAATRGE